MRNNNHKYEVWNPKKYLIFFIFLILFIIILVASNNSKVLGMDYMTLRVGVYENPPKIFTDDKGKVSGFWPDIIEYIALQEGWQKKWVWGSWSECLERLENKEIDLMPDVSFTEPRSKDYALSQEIILVSWTRIYAREGAHIDTILDLEAKKIGVMTGSSNFTGPEGIKELSEKFGIHCTFVEMNNYSEIFEALEKGEIDAGVTNKDFGNAYEKDFDIERTPIIFGPSHIQFAFPNNSSLTPYLLEKIDYYIKELKENNNSIYYQSLEKWLAVKVDEKEVIPEWLNWLLIGIGGIALLLFGGNFILRSQVRSKTKELREEATERKKAEKALIKSEERYRTVFENTGSVTMIIEDDNTVSMVNTQCEKLIGYSKEEIENKMKWTDFVVPEDLEEMKKYHIVRRKAGEKPPTEYEFHLMDKKGVVKNIFLKISIMPGSKKSITSLIDITELKQSEEKLKKTMNATIETISKIVEAKDPYTAGHQQRVSQLTTAIAKELNLSQDKVEGARIASLIHDIGKIGIPTEILSKPTKLTDIEFRLIKAHPQMGYDILKSNDFSYPVANIVLQHHERLNGSGYPNKLKGDDILLEAKIIGVADVVEAMSSNRPYRPALGIDKALEEISQNRGILYDPKVVDTCLKLFKEKGFKFE